MNPRTVLRIGVLTILIFLVLIIAQIMFVPSLSVSDLQATMTAGR